MSVILFNPTDEVLEGFHIGERYAFKPNDKMKVTDRAGRHLMTHLSNRGLVSLEYGDDEKEKAKEGLERNKTFKMKQIGNFNQLNEANKIQGLPYAQPPEAVMKYAKEIGVDLKQPYVVENVQMQNALVGSGLMNEIKNENTELKSQMEELKNQLNEILAATNKQVNDQKEVGAKKDKTK